MGLFRSVARPLLFMVPPETAHHLAGTALRAPLPWARIAGRVSSIPTDLCGVALENPVGLAAGFDKSASMVDGLAGLGFGYVVIGTVSREPRTGNPKPRIRRVASQRALINAMGIPNDGVEAVARRLAGRRSTVPVFASIADEDPDDVAVVHERLEADVAGFELNVSSPNSPWRHSGRDNVAHLHDVLDRIAGRRAKPLFIKVPPFDPARDDAQVMTLVKVAADFGVAGITCSNTRPVVAEGLPNGRGGLSGGPLTDGTPRIVEAVRTAAPDLVVNACGGISEAAHAQRCLDAGATTVQLYTGLIYEGPSIVRTICDGLEPPDGSGPG